MTTTISPIAVLTILAALAPVMTVTACVCANYAIIARRRLNRVTEELAIADDKLVEAVNEYWAATNALRNLRRNAFLTDERGVRVKYANASRDVRERAEAN